MTNHHPRAWLALLAWSIGFIQPLPASADCAQPGQYVSSPWGFHTNSFWIAGPRGTLMIDTQFQPSATREALALAERCSGQAVVAALVLHANPDKFNGTQWLSLHGVEVLSSRAVVAAIPAVDSLRRSWFEDRYRPDYPDKLVLPQAFGDDTRRIVRGGVAVDIYLLGAAVSSAHVIADWKGHLFVGDLVANRHHAWLELGLIDEWIATLEFLQGLRPLRVYPGRGAPGGAELLARQIEYLRFVRTTVQAARPQRELDGETLEALVKAVVTRYPDYGNEYFLQLGIPAVWEKLGSH